MKTELLLIPVLVAIVVAAGLLVKQSNETDPQASTSSVPTSFDADRIASLEKKIEILQSRIELIEKNKFATTQSSPDLDTTANVSLSNLSRINPPSNATFFNNSPVTEPTNMAENLISIGIDTFTAENIANKRNQWELARLELRNTAIRENYIGTDRFREEIRNLDGGDLSIRNEVGDDYYDRYLFASGRPNRIGVNSVMTGSAADNAGMQNGDILLSYAGDRLFNFSELQDATTRGEPKELVDVVVNRNGSEVTFSMPRGPLGIRLSSTRIDPDSP